MAEKLDKKIPTVSFDTVSQIDRDPFNQEIDTYGCKLEWYKTARRMRKDPTFALARVIMAAPLISNEWRVEGSDKEAVRLVEEVLFPHRQQILKESIFSCIDYGWQAWEVVPLYIPGIKDVHIDIKPLKHDITRLRADREGRPNGCTNASPNLGHFIERRDPNGYLGVTLERSEMAQVAGSDEYGNPYGSALLKNGENVFRRYEAIEALSHEFNVKIAGATKVVKYPVGESNAAGDLGAELDGSEETVKSDNADIAKNLANSTQRGVSLPTQSVTLQNALTNESKAVDTWSMELLESRHSRDPYLDRSKYYDSLKMRSVLLPERVALEGQHGTKAESATHADLALLGIDQWGKNVLDWNNQRWGFVGRILEFNGLAWYPGRVRVVPLPLTDDTKLFMREIFRTAINNTQDSAFFLNLLELGERANIPIDHATITKLRDISIDTRKAQAVAVKTAAAASKEDPSKRKPLSKRPEGKTEGSFKRPEGKTEGSFKRPEGKTERKGSPKPPEKK